MCMICNALEARLAHAKRNNLLHIAALTERAFLAQMVRCMDLENSKPIRVELPEKMDIVR